MTLPIRATYAVKRSNGKIITGSTGNKILCMQIFLLPNLQKFFYFLGSFHPRIFVFLNSYASCMALGNVFSSEADRNTGRVTVRTRIFI